MSFSQPDLPSPHSPPASRAPVPGIPGRALAWVYARIIAARNRRFDARRGVVEVDRPVISIGNLSTGGTGKTPLVSHLTALLIRHGHTPCIAMRGYGSPAGQGLMSDEALIYKEACPGVQIVAQPNRLEGLLDVFASPSGEAVDVVLLDDGFQHRQLARSLDIVVIDATRSPFEDRLLPAGHLRESPAALRRAHAVVITHAASISSASRSTLLAHIRAVHPAIEISLAVHAWNGFNTTDPSGESRFTPSASFAGARIFAACAIGNPSPFLAQAAAVGSGERGRVLTLAGQLALPDHDPFAEATVQRLIRMAQEAHAQVIIITAKDWTKLGRVAPARWPCPVARPNLVIEFQEGQDRLEHSVLRAASAETLG